MSTNLLKLGIISDTHGCVPETTKAIRLFRKHGVQTVIHCGDIGNDAVVKAFRSLETHFVLGNLDADEEMLQAAITGTGNHFHGWCGYIEKAGIRIAFMHGHQEERFNQEVASGRWDLLCYGHTHVAELQKKGTTWLLNPGAFIRVEKPTVAVVTLPELSIELFTLKASGENSESP